MDKSFGNDLFSNCNVCYVKSSGCEALKVDSVRTVDSVAMRAAPGGGAGPPSRINLAFLGFFAGMVQDLARFKDQPNWTKMRPHSSN
eukprot:4726607-Amphidinium_carterae.1